MPRPPSSEPDADQEQALAEHEVEDPRAALLPSAMRMPISRVRWFTR